MFSFHPHCGVCVCEGVAPDQQTVRSSSVVTLSGHVLRSYNRRKERNIYHYHHVQPQVSFFYRCRCLRPADPDVAYVYTSTSTRYGVYNRRACVLEVVCSTSMFFSVISPSNPSRMVSRAVCTASSSSASSENLLGETRQRTWVGVGGGGYGGYGRRCDLVPRTRRGGRAAPLGAGCRVCGHVYWNFFLSSELHTTRHCTAFHSPR